MEQEIANLLDLAHQAMPSLPEDYRLEQARRMVQERITQQGSITAPQEAEIFRYWQIQIPANLETLNRQRVWLDQIEKNLNSDDLVVMTSPQDKKREHVERVLHGLYAHYGSLSPDQVNQVCRDWHYVPTQEEIDTLTKRVKETERQLKQTLWKSLFRFPLKDWLNFLD